MSKFDLDVLHQTISDTQSNICQAVIVKGRRQRILLGKEGVSKENGSTF